MPVTTTPNEPYAYSVPTIGDPQPVTYPNTSSDTTDDILKYRVRDLLRADVGLGWKRFTAGVSARYNSHVRNIDKVFVDFDKGPPSPDILPVGASGMDALHTRPATGWWTRVWASSSRISSKRQ